MEVCVSCEQFYIRSWTLDDTTKNNTLRAQAQITLDDTIYWPTKITLRCVILLADSEEGQPSGTPSGSSHCPREEVTWRRWRQGRGFADRHTSDNGEPSPRRGYRTTALLSTVRVL